MEYYKDDDVGLHYMAPVAVVVLEVWWRKTLKYKHFYVVFFTYYYSNIYTYIYNMNIFKRECEIFETPGII
jgi:hypothetical protein